MDRFLLGALHAERIDSLGLSGPQKSGKKADYFYSNRDIVIEMKSIVQNRETAVSKVLNAFRRQPDWPRFKGELGFPDLVRLHPRGAELNRRMFDEVTWPVRNAALKADKQVAATARHFGLNGPMGVLLLLNERVDALEPVVMGTAASNAIKARKPDGTRELACLDTIIIVTWAHTVQANERERSMALLWVPADELNRSERSSAFERWFMEMWSAQLGAPPRDGGVIETLDDVTPLDCVGRLPPTAFDGDVLPPR